MVLVKLLGLLDIICAVIFLLIFFRIDIVWWLNIVFGAYLLLKALVFRKNLVSLGDGLIGLVLLLALFWQFRLFSAVIALYLGLKGIASLR